MIIYKQGNLFEDEAEAFVNAVNLVGVMGAGIALQFKKRYPEMFKDYKKQCKAGKLALGTMHVYKRKEENPKYIINFPTLYHWKDKSKLKDIKQGLEDLLTVVKKKKIKSIAIPALGCGVGGLEWREVKQVIENTFKDSKVQVHLYEPL